MDIGKERAGGKTKLEAGVDAGSVQVSQVLKERGWKRRIWRTAACISIVRMYKERTGALLYEGALCAWNMVLFFVNGSGTLF